MAKKLSKPAAEEVVVPSEAAAVIDDTLPVDLQNPAEVGGRVNMLVEATVLASLSASIPNVQEGSAGDVKIFSRFIGGVRNGIDAACRAILSVSDSVSGITNAVKSASFDLGNFEHVDGKGHSQQVIAAIRQASGALRLCLAEFTIDDLADEDALLAKVLEKRLTVESFLSIQKAQLVMTEKKAARVPVASFFKSSATKVDTVEEEGEVFEFVWSWDDNVLFSRNKIPEMRHVIIDEDRNAAARSQFISAIREGHSRWLEFARKTITKKTKIVNASGKRISKDQYLQEVAALFEGDINRAMDTFMGYLVDPNISVEDIKILMDEMHKSIKSWYANTPDFNTDYIRPPLEELFRLFDHYSVILPPTVESSMTSEYGAAYFQEVESILICPKKGEVLFIHPDSLDTDLLSLAQKVTGETQYKYGNKQALRASVRLLCQLIRESAVYTDEDFSVSTPEEYALYLQRHLERMLQIIFECPFEDISPVFASIFRNALSLFVTKPIRLTALTRPLLLRSYSEASRRSAYLDIINDFYPKPPLSTPKAVVPKITEVAVETPSVDSLLRAFASMRDEAFGQLKMKKDGKNSEVDKRIQNELISPAEERQIFECIRTVSGRVMRTKEDAERYLAAFQGIIDAVPQEITVGKDIIAVPAEFRDYLQSRFAELSAYLLSCCTDSVSSNGDAVQVRVGFVNAFADIMQRAQKVREERVEVGGEGVGSGLVSRGGKGQEGDKKKDTGTRLQDPLAEAMEASGTSGKNVGRYVAALFEDAIDQAVARQLGNMVHSRSISHVEEITAEMMSFASTCMSRVDSAVLSCIQQGTEPSISQLRAVAEGVATAMSQQQSTEFQFVSAEQCTAIVEEVCRSFGSDDIDAAELMIGQSTIVLVQDGNVSEAEVADGLDESKAQKSQILSFPALQKTAQGHIAHRARSEARQRAQEARDAHPALEQRIGSVEGRISSKVHALLQKAGDGDPDAKEIIDDYLAFQEYILRSLLLRSPSE